MTTEHKFTTFRAERKGNTVADWQPIETAPDAPFHLPLLLVVPGERVGLGWRLTEPNMAAGWYWLWQEPFEVADIHPTHWAYPPYPPEDCVCIEDVRFSASEEQ